MRMILKLLLLVPLLFLTVFYSPVETERFEKIVFEKIASVFKGWQFRQCLVIPLLMTRTMVIMKTYFNKWSKFSASALIGLRNHFAMKIAVNAIA